MTTPSPPENVKMTVSDERLAEMLKDAISERDRPIIGDGSLYDFAPAELVLALEELQSLRRSSSRGEVKPRGFADWKSRLEDLATAIENGGETEALDIVEELLQGFDDVTEAEALASVIEQEQAEPVAWRVRERPGFDWRFVDGDPDRDPRLAGFEKQALYASPPSTPEVDDGKIDRFGTAFWGPHWRGTEKDRAQARAALAAALSPEAGK